MKNIVILIPTAAEARFFIPPHDIRTVICGVGMAECAATAAKLISEGIAAGQKPDLMILAGTAGSYVSYLKAGETFAVVSETVADLGRLAAGPNGYVDFKPLFRKTYPAPVVPRGFRSVRANTVSSAGANVGWPVEAELENMEGAAFFAVCEQLGVPAIEIRTVSNRVGDNIARAAMELAVRRLGMALEKLISSYERGDSLTGRNRKPEAESESGSGSEPAQES